MDTIRQQLQDVLAKISDEDYKAEKRQIFQLFKDMKRVARPPVEPEVIRVVDKVSHATLQELRQENAKLKSALMCARCNLNNLRNVVDTEGKKQWERGGLHGVLRGVLWVLAAVEGDLSDADIKNAMNAWGDCAIQLHGHLPLECARITAIELDKLREKHPEITSRIERIMGFPAA